MKKLFVSVIAAITLISTLAAADQPTAKKLPVVPLLHRDCVTEVIVCVKEREVRYECDDMKKGGTWAVFTAHLDGRLKSLRVVMVDSTVYQWEVANGYDSKEVPIISGGMENGVHADNGYTLDRQVWFRFYERYLRLPPIQVR